MKIIFVLILWVIIMNVDAQHTAHWKVATKGADGHVQFSGLVSGDTLAIDGNLSTWSYCFMGQLQFDCNNPLTIININGQVKMTNGFNLVGCRGIKITGSGAIGVRYGFYVNSGGGGVSGPRVRGSHCAKAIVITNQATTADAIRSSLKPRQEDPCFPPSASCDLDLARRQASPPA